MKINKQNSSLKRSRTEVSITSKKIIAYLNKGPGIALPME